MPDHIAREIFKIPLIHIGCKDRIAWHYSANGKYSVKSGYRVALSLSAQTLNCPGQSGSPSPLWKWIWNLEVPPKVRVFMWKTAHGRLPVRAALHRRSTDTTPYCQRCGTTIETVEHTLRDCPWSQFFWRASPLRLDNLLHTTTASIADMLMVISKMNNNDGECLFAMLLWALWRARNVLIFQGKEMSHMQCFDIALRCLNDFQSNKLRGRKQPAMPQQMDWTPPPEGHFKINTDASVMKNEGTGLGAVLRDHAGNILHTRSEHLTVDYSVEIAEALACRKGLLLARDLHLDHIQLETDCMKVVQAHNSHQSDLSYFGTIINDIRSIGNSFSSFSVIFTRRTANTIAHNLAKFAFSNSCNGFYSGSLPPELDFLYFAEDFSSES
ncbi:hypothetical protein DH2020_030069 [Rehmannia glutinosa]|uniref:Uncharacterized protein n=1 Tax=Rehmannia glutinosa TaxID=99300 RepID=A0ABR0VLS2_REHGL